MTKMTWSLTETRDRAREVLREVDFMGWFFIALPHRWYFNCDACRIPTYNPYAMSPHAEPLHHGTTDQRQIIDIIGLSIIETS